MMTEKTSRASTYGVSESPRCLDSRGSNIGNQQARRDKVHGLEDPRGPDSLSMEKATCRAARGSSQLYRQEGDRLVPGRSLIAFAGSVPEEAGSCTGSRTKARLASQLAKLYSRHCKRF